MANLDPILCVASMGWGEGCMRFWGRLTLANWTQVSDRCPLGYLFFMLNEWAWALAHFGKPVRPENCIRCLVRQFIRTV